MALLAKATMNRCLVFKLSEVFPCFSYSKRMYLLQNMPTTCVSGTNNTAGVTEQRTSVEKIRPLSPEFAFLPKFFCSDVHIKCWHCGKLIENIKGFCGECNKLQPLDRTLNYFEVLGIEKAFAIDTKSLTKVFRKLQGKFHPDKFSIGSETEKEYALDHSSEINKAYRCLLNPVERALYLLDLAGQPLHEGQLDLDPEFLMEIMEVNEQLAEAADKEAVAKIALKNQKILDGLLMEADAAFSRNDIQTARSIVAKVKYYNNIYLKVKDYERQHGIYD
ncbi:iron-sulfur cluster co-chaperone protein HscB [Palaemon carinicauda]|uniref:iron-sulfur cluster co-chaperone protein HscB n=1 Tax=Palaemon carinicauda TaxID=392227 RepID=UPI0035B681E7